MDKPELLTLAAAQIAGGMAGAIYGQAGKAMNQAVFDFIAQTSLTIAHQIAQEAEKLAKRSV
jgi:hypothetical protein